LANGKWTFWLFLKEHSVSHPAVELVEPLPAPLAVHDSMHQASPDNRCALSLRHLRGYPLRNYRMSFASRPLILSGPMSPDDLLAEPRVEQRFDEDDYMPYWSDLWPASAGMADYLLATELRPAGPHRLAVELGCGLGLAGVAAGMLGWHVVFTDYDADALAYAAFNAATNNLRGFSARLVDWRSPPTDLQADLLLAADVLYEGKRHAPLLRCIWELLSATGIALVTDPRRDGAKGFADSARHAGLQVSLGYWADRQPGGQTIPMDLFFLRKPGAS
jgi:predicted nicotinamide N-methyase